MCTTAALGTTVQRAEDRQRSQEAEEQRFSNELHGLQQTLRSLSTSVPAGVGGLSVGPRALSGLVPDVASASRTVPATESSERAKRAHVGPRHKEH